MLSVNIIGADPGSNGCAALILPGVFMPDWFRLCNETYPRLLRWLERIEEPFGECKVYMEHVHWRPSDKKHPTQIETMFRNAAKMELCFEIAGIEGEMVEPTTWQLEFGLGGIEEYADRKRAAQKKAQEIYNNPKITLDAADGILIATYGYRKERGELTNGKDTDKEIRQGTGLQWESRQKI